MNDLILIVVGLVGLFFGGEWLVKGSSRTALAFHVSPLVIGLTIVALGTSAPELLVAIQASLQGSQGIALGNVIGSNIANIGLILGLSGIVSPISVQDSILKREWPILMAVTLFSTLLVLDGDLSRLDGLLLIFAYVVYTGAFYYISRHEQTVISIEGIEEIGGSSKNIRLPIEYGRIALGIALLVIGANALVTGSVSLARGIGISELVIGLSLVAVGTSLPELATSLTAAFKQEDDIAVGNIIGSNIANLCLILGVAAFISPINVAGELSIVEFLVMIGFTLVLFPFMRNASLSRVESALLLGAYLAFVVYSFSTNPGAQVVP